MAEPACRRSLSRPSTRQGGAGEFFSWGSAKCLFCTNKNDKFPSSILFSVSSLFVGFSGVLLIGHWFLLGYQKHPIDYHINTTSKLGLPSYTFLRNQHGKIQVTGKGVSNKPRQQRNTGIWPIEAACRESTTQIRFPAARRHPFALRMALEDDAVIRTSSSSSMWRVTRAATLSILWKQDGHATQSYIVKRRKLRVPYVRKN